MILIFEDRKGLGMTRGRKRVADEECLRVVLPHAQGLASVWGGTKRRQNVRPKPHAWVLGPTSRFVPNQSGPLFSPTL